MSIDQSRQRRYAIVARAAHSRRNVLCIEALELRTHLNAIPYPATGFAINVGGAPQGIALADFNGDDLLDFASANFSSGQVNVVTDASFVTPFHQTGGGNYAAGSNLSGVAAADLNGDKKPDLVVTGDQVGILINKGDGTFKTVKEMNAGNTPQTSAVGDLNGDKKLDIVTANVLDSSATVFLGKGDGTFPTKKSPAVPNASAAAIGDVNGDGKADIVFSLFGDENTGAGAGVGVLIGNGDGTFKAIKTYVADGRPTAVALGDFNDDGKLDVVTANGGLANISGSTNHVSILLNNGDGTFGAATNITSGSLPASVSVADFDQDGFLDIATASSSTDDTSHDAEILQGIGKGKFSAPQALTIDSSGGGIASATEPGHTNPELFVSSGNASTVDFFSGIPQYATVADGTLSIAGKPTDDTISVTHKSGLINVRKNGKTLTFDPAAVSRIEIDAQAGNDVIDFSGVSINTYVNAGEGDDLVTAGSGNDTLTGGAGKDSLYGGAGDDRINGSGSPDHLYGQEGNDRLYGGASNDTMDGGGGTDRLYGGSTADDAETNTGNDVLIGGSSNDRLFGQDGNDTLYGQGQSDLCDGGAGTDTAAKDTLDSDVSIESLV